MEFEKALQVHTTTISGVYIIDLPVHGDRRGWFKENYQKAKMEALGLPSFRIVQNNMSYNVSRGVTRGIHAEPWSKYISVAKGRVFEVLLDVRKGSKTFGELLTLTLDESQALFVPEGVGNAFQSLEDDTLYTYLVTDHWSLESKSSYILINAADPALPIDWPIPLDEASRSDADLAHPNFADVEPYVGKRTLVIGAIGQLGSAFRDYVKECGIKTFDFVDRDELDICDSSALEKFSWSTYKTIINCAAYTAVDAAETQEGRALCWKLNAEAPAKLARIAEAHDIELVHISSDYVFDGVQKTHSEEESFSPLGVYGQSKAAGDLAVAAASRHYIVRTSWVIGNGKNFVRTMSSLAKRVKDSSDELNTIEVVDDQIGRLTFTNRLVEGIMHLLNAHAPYGTYNLTGAGAPASWHEIACSVFEYVGADPKAVRPITSAEYKEKHAPQSATRPHYSTLALDKIEASSYSAHAWREDLLHYLQTQDS